jgi:hypothetical protein
LSDGYRKVGSTLGTRTDQYLDHINRYNLSRSLAIDANEMERNWIRNFTNYISRKAWRSRLNYGLKATMATIFLYSLCKSRENYNLLSLKKRHLSWGETYSVYRSTMTSFLFASATFILI